MIKDLKSFTTIRMGKEIVFKRIHIGGIIVMNCS